MTKIFLKEELWQSTGRGWSHLFFFPATSIIPDQKRLIPKQRTHKEIERLDLKKIAADKGFIICDNPASGNCVFHALSQQLKRVKGINISHEEIRKDSVRFLENFPNQVRSILLRW